MRRVDYLHVLLVIEIPDLRHEGDVGVNEALYLFFEGADYHGVGHGESKGMMKLHFFVDSFEMFVFE